MAEERESSQRSTSSAADPALGQAALFPEQDMLSIAEDIGYRGPTACSAAGIT